jgi:hypothetical protein
MLRPAKHQIPTPVNFLQVDSIREFREMPIFCKNARYLKNFHQGCLRGQGSNLYRTYIFSTRFGKDCLYLRLADNVALWCQAPDLLNIFLADTDDPTPISNDLYYR